MTLQGIPVGDFWERVVLVIIAVSIACILFLMVTPQAHAHGAQDSTTDRGLQPITQVIALGADQKQPEELPTCHHGVAPCSSNLSIAGNDGSDVRRTGSSVSFPVTFGPPSASFLPVDPPPPKT